MALLSTTPGTVYAVEADGEIEIINSAGVTVYTGENALTFPAVGTEYTVMPDTAEVKQLFKGAPAALLCGGGVKLTPPYIAYTPDRKSVTAADLSGLTSGVYLFHFCTSLSSFSSALPQLVSSENMFSYCTSLSSFGSALPQLKTATAMFFKCSRLSRFSVALPELTSARQMFHDSSLSSFSSALSQLSDGTYMFTNCKLDKASALNVLNTIPAYTTGSHNLSLGMAAALNGDADITAALTAAQDKGWTVTAQYI